MIVVQPKIDGIALGLRYVDGKLVDARTRRNRCVLDWVMTSNAVPKQLKRKSKGMVEIHGEIWGLPKDSQDDRTPQRIASVSAKQNRECGARSCFAAYRLIGSLTNESQAMEDLRRCGFSVPDTYVCTKPSEVFYTQWMEGHVSEEQPFNTSIFKGWPRMVSWRRCSTTEFNVSSAGKERPNWAIALKANGIG